MKEQIKKDFTGFSLKPGDKEKIKFLKEHGINISFILRECINDHYQKLIQ